MKFVLMLRKDEVVPRKDLGETLKAFVSALKDPKLESFQIQFIGKADKKGKMQVDVLEFPISKK